MSRLMSMWDPGDLSRPSSIHFWIFPETVIVFLFWTNFCYVKFPVNIYLLTNHLEKAKDLFCRKGKLKNSFIELFSQS